jgi:hypothetical protein
MARAKSSETKSGRSVRGEESFGDSKAAKYSQHVTSPKQHEEYEGRSLITRDHEVIRRWAEERKARPATIKGSRHDDHLGVLRFNFPGFEEDGNLEEVSWNEWFGTFDARNLNFVYQEHKSDGKQSNFFRLDNPDREDA